VRLPTAAAVEARPDAAVRQPVASGRRRVVYLQYTNPAAYPPLEHSAHILADAGCDVLMLGTGLKNDPLRLKPHSRIRVRLMRFQGAGWRQKVHYARFAAWAIGRSLLWRPSWIYASDPLSCPIALTIARVTRTRMIYHEHDSPAPDEAGSPGFRFMTAVAAARRAVATHADVCVLPNARRAELFRQGTSRPDALIVWNCPARREAEFARQPAPPGRLRVVYHGSVVPSRLPLAVVHALARLPAGVSLTVIGYETTGHSGYGRRLQAEAEKLGVQAQLTIAPPVPRATLLEEGTRFDVGIAFVPRESADLNETTMVGASNKAFDYMAGGLAVLVSDVADWRDTYAEAGFGLSCDPNRPDSVAHALRWFLEHPEETAGMGERGRRKILADWNYERLFAPVLARMFL
jgi:glycosyltransferase involved in cell wall biosynthesis